MRNAARNVLCLSEQSATLSEYNDWFIRGVCSQDNLTA